MLIAAKEEQEPIKDRAIASIKEMNENILSTMEKAGYVVPNRDSFDLANETDYNMAVQKMKELQNAKSRLLLSTLPEEQLPTKKLLQMQLRKTKLVG